MKTKITKPIAPDLIKALESSNGERDAAAYLAKNPALVRWAFGSTGGHSAYVLHEFPFGSKYKADFVVLTSWSGAWEVVFIELEPVIEKYVTKSGGLTKRVAGAVTQITNWEDYILRNRALIQQDLSEWCKRRDKLKQSTKGRDPSNYSGNKLKDPETHINFEFGIVAGRRDKITADARSQAQKFASKLDITFRSYDVFVDIARKLDRVAVDPRDSVCLINFDGH